MIKEIQTGDFLKKLAETEPCLAIKQPNKEITMKMVLSQDTFK